MKKLFAALAGALMLASCVTAPPPDSVARPGVLPVPLTVARIEVRDDYQPPLQPPHIEHMLNVTPAAAARDLVQKTLVAAGPDKTLRVVISDASITDEALPVTEGWKGMLTQEPSNRYRGRVALRFELVDDSAPDIILGHAEVISDRTSTVMKGSSPAERDAAQQKLVSDMMKDVADGLRDVVGRTFGAP